MQKNHSGRSDGVEYINRHRTTSVSKNETSGPMFSDLSHGYWASASRLHKIAEDDSLTNDGGLSQFTPSCIVLYCISADALMNSLLGAKDLLFWEPEFNERERKQFCYNLTCKSVSADKLKEFAKIFRIEEKFDDQYINDFKLLENIRGEVVHFVPVLSEKGAWRSRVLEFCRRAGVPKKEISCLSWGDALCKIEMARLCREIVLGLSRRIESGFNWDHKIFPDSMENEI